jgi:glycogen phosphorylase
VDSPQEYPNLPEALAGLAEIAGNLWWSWHPKARMLFKTLDRQRWKEATHNPVRMLRELPGETLLAAAVNPAFMDLYRSTLAEFREGIGQDRGSWFRQEFGENRTSPIAYFSAEYGLHHSLPFYAGGLGFLAGDFVKECSDLGVPLLALGFMYPEGYIRQRIREDGWQLTLDEMLDREEASIRRVFNDAGEQIVIKVPLVEPPIHIALWKISVGRIPLFLMDTDIDANDPWNRRISQHLYTGDLEQRLRQEIVLGVGGSAALEALGIRHSVIHLNEGNAAFALLERLRETVASGMSFPEAVENVRATSVFTTHTPVPAGHDVFPFQMVDKYFSAYFPALDCDYDQFMALGVNPAAPTSGFNMTALAIRLSAYHNGVSLRHQEVARRMWQVLWPELPEEEVPIDHVTNGVHVPTWIEPKLEMLFNNYLGPDWKGAHDDPAIWQGIASIPDRELWQTHNWLKTKLFNAIRESVRQRCVADRVAVSTILAGGTLLDPSVLTIGFARRFASYKRAGLILHDMARLKKLLADRWKPIQIVFAGKAHPADDEGKRILQRVYNTARDPEIGGRIAFIEDYDEQLAQYMVHGVDAWLNNPLPPMEACGTSGMKAALNGVPHLSILDGWWVEGYNGSNGWAFGSSGTPEGDGRQADSDELYTLIEKVLIPLFYDVDQDGTPRGWVRVMKESIMSNAARFSARRMVKQYARKFYRGALARS